MDEVARSAQIVRFGVFEADLRNGELHKNGVKVPLQGQPFQVCAILLEHSGELVTREELRQEVWPEDTFVDFDQALNTAITKIRIALGDEADNPRFVETLPRRGYRFIGPVDKPSSQALSRSYSKHLFEKFRQRATWIGLGAALLILLSTIAIWRLSRKPAQSPLPSVEVVPLVAQQGMQCGAAFSPDGNQVAFWSHGPNREGIYTTLIGGEKALRLTSNPGDCCTTWSPDGRQIAFIRHFGTEFAIYVVPSLGGTEHRLYKGPANFWTAGLDWSPDGRVLAFAEGSADPVRSWIALLSLADLTTRPLTSPVDQERDSYPAFSPDGSTLVFVRGSIGGAGEQLFVLPAKGGEPRRLTFDNSWIAGSPAWTKDGSDIVFSSFRGGLPSLWRISAKGGTARPVLGVGAPAFGPSIPRKSDQLVYVHFFRSDNIWRINLKDKKHRQGAPAPVISARGFNYRPNFSPDGNKIAFESDRLGYSDIWYCDSDGSNSTQLTSLHGAAGTARWSPDGHYIAFESPSQKYYEIYVVEVSGGRPRLVPTFPGADNGAPNWSRDGQWIYFYSDHERGPFQLWKVPFKGGPPVQVTRNGGVYAIESNDGRFLYYAKYEQPGIWKMPSNGGEETRVLDQPETPKWFNWGLSRNGIYFLNLKDPPNGRIEFFDFATREKIPIFVLEKLAPVFGGLALSRDGRSLLYGQNEFAEFSIMLVQNFR